MAFDFRNAMLRMVAVAVDSGNRISLGDFSLEDAPGRLTAQVVVVGQRGGLHQKGEFETSGRGWAGFQNQVEQRRQIFSLVVEFFDGKAVEPGGVDIGKIELLIIRAEFQKEVECQIQRAIGICVGAVDLVQDDDRAKAHFQRLRQDEAGLRHRAFLCIDEEQHGIDHSEHPFHLSRKVGVARSVDNIDLEIFVVYRSMFGKNCDPALSLLIVAVHDAFWNLFIFTKDIRLFQQIIEQCCFAMVNVRDDCDIADFLWIKHK